MISADVNSGQNDEPIGILYDGMVHVYNICVYFGRRIRCIEQFGVVMCDVWMRQPCGSCRSYGCVDCVDRVDMWTVYCGLCGYVDRVLWVVWMYGCVCLCE
jgi:hypothetical protein